MNTKRRYEVIVLGGGPAGCAVALSLARQGVRDVLVVEAGEYAEDRIGESIPPDARRLFHDLGILESFLDEGHEPSPGSCASWGKHDLGFNDHIFNPYGNGWHLDRRRFDHWLSEEVRATGIELLTNTRFVEVSRPEDGDVSVTICHGGLDANRSVVEARFCVDATGPRGRFARLCGAKRQSYDSLLVTSAYFQVGTMEGAVLPRLTVLEAVEYGWWYLARLPNNRVAVAVASSQNHHKQSRLHHPQPWLQALAKTKHIFPKLLDTGASPIEGTLSTCTAPSFVLDPIVEARPTPRWLAVGDAASCFDPISSQGIYKALSNGLDAGAAIGAMFRGDDSALLDYARQVQQQFKGYLEQRQYFYGVEKRWENAEFWQERVEASSLSL